MLKLDVWNIVFTIINLLVLYFIFKKFLFKPVLNVIKEREDKINGQFEEAKKANEDAERRRRLFCCFEIKFSETADSFWANV